GRLDVAIISSAPPDRLDIEVTPLCSFAMHFVASPAFNIDRGAPLSPRELAGYPIIGYPPGTPSQARIEEYFAGEVQQTVIIHASAALPTNVQMATSGIGITAVPLAAVSKEIEQGLLVALPTTKPFAQVHYVGRSSAKAAASCRAPWRRWPGRRPPGIARPAIPPWRGRPRCPNFLRRNRENQSDSNECRAGQAQECRRRGLSRAGRHRGGAAAIHIFSGAFRLGGRQRGRQGGGWRRRAGRPGLVHVSPARGGPPDPRAYGQLLRAHPGW